MTTLNDTLARQLAQRIAQPEATAVKVNLYKPVEVYGVAEALRRRPEVAGRCLVECLMFADSVLMTHWNRASTIVPAEEQALLFDVVVSMVADLAVAVRDAFAPGERPVLMGDMPDGCTRSAEQALRSAERLTLAGADSIKIEVTSDAVFDVIERVSAQGIGVVAHLGYTPQSGEANRRFGATWDEAQTVFAQARRARDVGAVQLVLERVTPAVNQALSRPDQGSLPIYSIFSGRARCGGQSLNVWDAVFKPPFEARFFPPTGIYDRSQFLDVYTVDTIAHHMAELMALTGQGEFPKAPPAGLPPELAARIEAASPWLAEQARRAVA